MPYILMFGNKEVKKGNKDGKERKKWTLLRFYVAGSVMLLRYRLDQNSLVTSLKCGARNFCHLNIPLTIWRMSGSASIPNVDRNNLVLSLSFHSSLLAYLTLGMACKPRYFRQRKGILLRCIHCANKQCSVSRLFIVFPCHLEPLVIFATSSHLQNGFKTLFKTLFSSY